MSKQEQELEYLQKYHRATALKLCAILLGYTLQPVRMLALEYVKGEKKLIIPMVPKPPEDSL